MKIPKKEIIVNSALWAAFGDALGFPTELVTRSEFQKRHGKSESADLAPWSRRVGGMFGPTVELPTGAYSDDTQLRLSTCRSIQSLDFFDVESFAKIELPVWLNYALGGGRGTKDAAGNLALRETAWSQNFFDKYCEGGGNGAAMRVQPHVWLHAGSDWSAFLGDVVRNSVCTHGHPRALVGAAAHAALLAEAIRTGTPSSPKDWAEIGHRAAELAFTALENDSELPFVWITTWERITGKKLLSAWKDSIREWTDACHVAAGICESAIDRRSAYVQILHELNGYEAAERGSGLKCALYASALAWIGRDLSPAEALGIAANEFSSDTDTIASMAGALIGATTNVQPEGLQDDAYIRHEAGRISDLGDGKRPASFSYPDLLSWAPPRTQSDAWVKTQDGRDCLSGLGFIKPIGEPQFPKKGNLVWQWVCLDFGQTVLAKRRQHPLVKEAASQKVVEPRTKHLEPVVKDARPHDPVVIIEGGKPDQSDLFGQPAKAISVEKPLELQKIDPGWDLDTLTQYCIKSGFQPALVGEALLSLCHGPEALERAVAFAAVIAKARKFRER